MSGNYLEYLTLTAMIVFVAHDIIVLFPIDALKENCELFSRGVVIIEWVDVGTMDGGWRVHDSSRGTTVFVVKIDLDRKPASN